MDIEHFIPISERPIWFMNGQIYFRQGITPPRGYLNPCAPNDDVETKIIYTLSAYGETPSFNASPINQKAVTYLIEYKMDMRIECD